MPPRVVVKFQELDQHPRGSNRLVYQLLLQGKGHLVNSCALCRCQNGKMANLSARLPRGRSEPVCSECNESGAVSPLVHSHYPNSLHGALGHAPVSTNPANRATNRRSNKELWRGKWEFVE